MDSFAQLRRPNGSLPITGVESIKNAGSEVLSFKFPAPSKIAHGARSSSPDPQGNLIDLAACSNLAESEPHNERLLSLAEKIGPMFGCGDRATERMDSWFTASRVAASAVKLQEFSTGKLPFKALSQVTGIEASVFTNASTGASFELYVLYLPISAEYAAWFDGHLPLTHPCNLGTRYAYLFTSYIPPEDTESYGLIECIECVYDCPMRWIDYRTIEKIIGLGEECADLAQAQFNLGIEDEGPGPLGLDGAGQFEKSGVPRDDRCRSAAGLLVQALAAAHLWAARIDAFSANDETGILIFSSYLSWLWYDFSRQLSRVRIGYCERCGGPFSLVGHRGIARRFCSEACKVNTKNEREQRARDNGRSLFTQGVSIEAIAAAVYPRLDLNAAKAKVQRSLESWPELRHTIDDEIEERGWDDAPLLRHCIREELDIRRVLPKKWLERLDEAALQSCAKARK